MSKSLKKIAFWRLIFSLFQPVRILSYYRPIIARLSPEYCPTRKVKKCCLPVQLLPDYRPTTARLLSAQKRKKRTTPFGGMARPYYSLPTPLFHSSSSLFHLSYLSPIQLLKFSQEYSR